MSKIASQTQTFFAQIGALDLELQELFYRSTSGKKSINSFIRLIKEHVKDPRVQGKVKYPCADIIVMVFFGVMGGMRTIAEIQRFCIKKESYLRSYLKLRNGIPSEDTMMRVFSLINLSQLEQATVTYLIETFSTVRSALGIQPPAITQLCVDGKEARGSGRKSRDRQAVRNLQTLHVYDADHGICLISRQIKEKTNEIPIAQEVLRQLDLRHTLVTFDALHTQKETIAVISQRRGLFIGGLKSNQPFLSEEAQAFFTPEYIQRCEQEPSLSYVTTEKAHGNLEKREFFIVPVGKSTGSVFSQWKGITSIVMYRKTIIPCTQQGESKTELRMYVTNIQDVHLCGVAIRRHWEVENNLHWHLDANLKDDQNQTVNRIASGNLTLMKKMALSLFKLLQPFEKKRTSLNMITVDFIADFDASMRRLLTLCDDITLRRALESVTTR
jgi:predicted transposase YbfD/YdcC